MQDWLTQTPMTDPGAFAPAVAALSGDPETLVGAVRRLLVHGDWLSFYPEATGDQHGRSRATLPLSGRLARLGGLAPRLVPEREVGTCRDYAVALCGFFRAHRIAARVRCGFAAYFEPGAWTDHWICEWRPAGATRWARADGQLDGAHRDALGIGFDTLDVPADAYLSAAEAWERIVAGVPAEAFGHGEGRGTWFVRVNLARDLLALGGVEMSDWDRWRETRSPPPSAELVEACARDTAWIRMAETGLPAADPGRPFWLA